MIVTMILGDSIQPSFAAERRMYITDLHNPVGMVYDQDGQLLVAEWGTSRVCRYDAEGNRTLVTDEVGRPSGLAFGDEGNLYIASYDRNVIYRMESGKRPQVFASGFDTPAGLLWDSGSLLVANRDAGEILRIMPDGSKQLVSKGHGMPVGMVCFPDGSLVISCLGGTVERIFPDGSVTVVSRQFSSPAPGIIQDGDAAVLVVDYGGTRLARVSLDGETTTVMDGFQVPVGLARMPDGRVIVADWGEHAAFICDVKEP